MTIKPKGLSPDFNSIISPDIRSSLKFSWNFIKQNSRDYQKSATVKVYAKNNTTALLTQVIQGNDSFFDISPHINKFSLNGLYEWEVIVTGADNTVETSGKRPFKFVSAGLSESLNWPEGPDAYEYIGSRAYFETIKNNILSVLDDYIVDTSIEVKYKEAAQNLFLSEIIPARQDFVNIENILSFISSKESTYKDEVDDLIEDGLGAGDIHKIYGFLERLTRIPPKEPSNVYLSFAKGGAYGIKNAIASNQNDEDLTVDISWVPEDTPLSTCSIHFNEEENEDVAYYYIQLESGFKEYDYVQKLYFRVSDINSAGRKITFNMEHIEAEHLSSSKETVYGFSAQVVDRRGRTSSSYRRVYNVGDIPLGVESYEVRVKRNDVSNTKTIKGYYEIYSGKNTSFVHKVDGESVGYYYYAVKLLDKNGRYSEWFYIPNGIKIDPLKPPMPPKPYIVEQTTSTLAWRWEPVKDASYYEVFHINGQIVGLGIENICRFWDLYDDTLYTAKIRAGNRAGVSEWVSISARTNKRPPVEYVETGIVSRTWRTSYFIHKQNGAKRYPGAEYRYDLDNYEVLHGEWIELRDKYESGMYVKRGTRWGNHKSLYFLDHAAWRQRLQGKEILEVWFYIVRKSTPHGYPDDGRFLHVWTHDYNHVGELPPEWQGPSLENHHMATGLDWDRGQGHWVKLPNYYGELLRDGKMKGIALHHPNSTSEPYSYMRFDARSIQFYVKYR